MILYEDKERLVGVLDAVRNSPRTDFYRRKYEALPEHISGVQDLPFLVRDELVTVAPDERCFVALDEVAFVAYTSGTTSGKPLVTFFSTIDAYHVDVTWGVPVQRILVVFPPLNKNFCGTFIQQCREASPRVTPVFGDPANLAVSAYLGNMLQTDALYATPSLAFALAPYLAATKTHMRIKLLVISGETITEAQRLSLQALYPAALIANLYASSEIGQFIMGPNPAMLRDAVPGFTLLTEALVAAELIDNELVVSYAQNEAFPLLRYCTGDLFTVDTSWTDVYGNGVPVLSWLGKGGVDLVRVHGVEVRSGSVDAFFAGLALPIATYQLHIFEGAESGTLSLVLEYTQTGTRPVDSSYIHEQFLDTFYIRPGQTVRSAIGTDSIDTVVVKNVEALSWQGAKRRVLVNHVT